MSRPPGRCAVRFWMLAGVLLSLAGLATTLHATGGH